MAAYVIAVLPTPAGISGAVLLPFQVSVLGKGITDTEIAALFSISRPTVYRSLDRTTDLPPGSRRHPARA